MARKVKNAANPAYEPEFVFHENTIVQHANLHSAHLSFCVCKCIRCKFFQQSFDLVLRSMECTWRPPCSDTVMDVDCSLFDEGAGNEESGKDIKTETWIEMDRNGT